MTSKEEELLKRPLYVYDLPAEILNTIELKDDGKQQPTIAPSITNAGHDASSSSRALQPGDSTANAPNGGDRVQAAPGSASCTLCGAAFGNASEQRQHVRSDWHAYNLKQRLRGAAPVNEGDFERLLDDLDESISGSDSSSSTDDGDEDAAQSTKLSALLRRQARVGDDAQDGLEDGFGARKRKKGGSGGGPPMVWLTSSLLPANTSLGVYRALFTDAERAQQDLVATLRKKQLEPSTGKKTAGDDGATAAPSSSPTSGPCVFICMIGGGHFAAMIVSLTPEITRNKGVVERQAKTIAQKTFHRYTTRRKQGGAQSSNDNAKGNAKSAGAAIRRANELALEQDVRNLFREWRGLISACGLLFVRASGTTNRRVLFGPYDDQVLKTDDPRLRTIPFATRRATQQECMRAFVELTRVKVSHVDLAALAAADEAQRQAEERKASKQAATAATPKAKEGPSPEEEEAMLHSSQIQALIKRSKVPALLSYFSNNSLSPDFSFEPTASQANHHTSTPLHLAASLNSTLIVNALLIKAGANPSTQNGDGRPPFDLAGDRATRDAFRVARSELGEAKWDWTSAHVPSALTRSEAEKRDEEEKSQEAEREASRRRAEMQRLQRESAEDAESSKKAPGRMLGSGMETTAADKREQEARGLTPEMRVRLERERRARAAEERMRKLAGK